MTGKADASYRAALDYLFARTTGGTKFGLERTEALLALLGDPHRELRALHVAGTNGKGSVVATLEAVLRSLGLRVGAYTSPHLVDFRERIRVNGEEIPREAVTAFVDRWTPDAERLGATFFEVTTALAFDWLAVQEVDVAVIEAGLGGRLDSTNVIHPVVAGVTSVALDHTDLLGETLSAIAAEKAGIFKAGVPAVIGERDPVIRAELAEHALARGANPIHTVALEYPAEDVQVAPDGTRFTLSFAAESVPVRTPLIGEFQAWNVATAFAMLRAAGEPLVPTMSQLVSGLATVKLPGRFDRRGKHIFDVSHNPAGAAGLARTLRAVKLDRPVVALVAVLSDKDWRGVLRELAPVVESFVLTVAPTAPPNRRWDPAAAAAYAATIGARAQVVADFAEAIEIASRAGETVLVTGSFHTVGDAMSRLQVSPMAA